MSRSETQIQGTGDSCTLSKYSLSLRGYVRDHFISHFVTKPARRAPLINLGYFARAHVISEAIKSFLSFVDGKPAQIISCGAGFDTNYFVLSGLNNLGPNIVYVEIDYTHVVVRKKGCIQNSSKLSNLIEDINTACDCTGINGNQYKLIGCDIEKIDELSESLKSHDISFWVPTLFFSECAITYMKEESSSQLIKWAAENFKDSSFVTYEQINPFDGFGLVMISHFQKLHSPLQSVEKYPTLDSQKARYIELGWSSCSAESVLDLYLQSLSKGKQIEILSIEPFDEFEEWHSKCCHYSLSVATKGVLDEWKPLSYVDEHFPPELPSTLKCSWVLIKSDLRRYQHSSCVFGKDQFLVFGGFGAMASGGGGSSRLNDVSLLKINESTSASSSISLHVEAPPEINLARVHHSAHFFNSRKVLIFGGRTSPLEPLSDCLLVTVETDECNVPKFVRVEPLSLSLNETGPCPRWRFSSVVVGNDEHRELLVFGGRGKDLQTWGDLWVLDMKNRVWREENFEYGPRPRFSHSAAVWEEKNQILVSCGLTESGSGYPLNDIWSWNHSSKDWVELKTAEDWPHSLLPRYGHSSLVATDPHGGDILIMVGGINAFSGNQPGVGVFHLQKMTSMEYAFPVPSPEFPLMIFNHSCHMSSDKTEIIIIGGGGMCFSFGTSFNDHIVKIDVKQFF